MSKKKLTITLDNEVYEDLKTEAKKDSRPVSNMINFILKLFLKRNK